ncbi:hypothetical protein SAMN06272735_1004 [Streptomyces sp. TLI_55]|uniref:hypothetical protein n=1 Tax=Streptomyces sp. TLI_55 TaxID=1938861 RepID=UPI000BC8E533|nr:hypothetical protein [Streptomyces sp. TLI_55]SNX56552.1 hypothetical protein SAMN06272735_1004 [Streptomyces sp. TLI_55]
MRRWVKVAVSAAVVLGVGGWIATPYAQDWWLLRTACDGVLPVDAVRELGRDGDHFKDAESATHEELGDYSCSLGFDGDDVRDDRLFATEAYTRRDDVDREFMTVLSESGFDRVGPMADGLPGYVDKYGALQFLLPCPELGKDDEGRQRKLLVRTWLGRDTLRATPAAYETAVALTNSASDRLGCGAEPLKAPDEDAAPVDPQEDPKTVPLADAGDTACGWALKAGGLEAAQWRVAVLMNDAGPVGRCDLYARDADSGEWEPRLWFAAWYGDWSNRLLAEERRHGTGSRTATARCDGEAANFALSAAKDVPGVDGTGKRELFAAFTEAQVAQRNCTRLRLGG